LEIDMEQETPESALAGLAAIASANHAFANLPLPLREPAPGGRAYQVFVIGVPDVLPVSEAVALEDGWIRLQFPSTIKESNYIDVRSASISAVGPTIATSRWSTNWD
jgi:hypothetical protein